MGKGIGTWLIYYKTPYGDGNYYVTCVDGFNLDGILSIISERHSDKYSVNVLPAEVVIVNMIKVD